MNTLDAVNLPHAVELLPRDLVRLLCGATIRSHKTAVWVLWRVPAALVATIQAATVYGALCGAALLLGVA